MIAFKENTQNWFDGEVLEKLRSRDKTRLHINKELCKKAKYDAQKLIAAKKPAFFDEKMKVLANQKNYGIPWNFLLGSRILQFQTSM